jgi:hypothetical protein
MAASSSDLPDGEGWQDYCKAAQRKIDIAGYHLECLRAQVGEGRLGQAVPVAVQAHFEGVLFAFVAAADQVAEAINLGMKLGLRRPNSNLKRVLEAMPPSPIQSRLSGWHDAPIAADVRDLRVRATHHHYAKTPSGPRTLVAQEPTRRKPYGGSRELVSYGEAAVTHVGRLRGEVDGLKDFLGSSLP